MCTQAILVPKWNRTPLQFGTSRLVEVGTIIGQPLAKTIVQW
jgi:hypothetical protein